MTFKIKLEDVERAAVGQWDYVFAKLAPALNDAIEQPKKHQPCPIHGGKDGFRLFDDYKQRGGGICNTCGAKAGGISLLMWVNEWDFKETLYAVAGALGITEETNLQPSSQEPTQHAPSPEDSEKVRKKLRDVWGQCVEVSHKDAEPLRLYLLRRRLDYLELPSSIRFHSSLPYYDDERNKVGNFPAMVCSIFDCNGKPVTLHRTYLTLEGFRPKGLAPKKFMAVPPDASLMGAAIWLSPLCATATEVAVTEGIETGIAVQLGKGIPTFAAGSASGIKAWEPPAHVTCVIVFGDKDRPVRVGNRTIKPGQDAVRHLISNLWEKKVQASGMIPSPEIPQGRKSLDWADIYARYGKAGFVTIDREVNRG